MTDNRIDVQAYAIPTKGGGAASQAGESERRDAWLREMEKQEMAAWLNHGPIPASPRNQQALAQRSQPFQPVWQSDRVATAKEAVDRQTIEKVPAGSKAAEARPLDRAAQAVDSQPEARAAENGSAAELTADRPLPAQKGDLPAPVILAREEDRVAVQRFVETVMGQLKCDDAALEVGRFALVRQAQSEPVVVTAAVKADVVLPVSPSRGALAWAAHESVGDNERCATTDENAELERHPAGTQQTVDEPAPPVRVHAFWSEQAVRIWIGAERSAALGEQQLAFAVQDLKRLLRQQGVTLTSLTINGETIVADDGAAEPGSDSRSMDEIGQPATPVRVEGFVRKKHENGEEK